MSAQDGVKAAMASKRKTLAFIGFMGRFGRGFCDRGLGGGRGLRITGRLGQHPAEITGKKDAGGGKFPHDFGGRSDAGNDTGGQHSDVEHRAIAKRPYDEPN